MKKSKQKRHEKNKQKDYEKNLKEAEKSPKTKSRIREEDLPVHPICYCNIFSIPLASSTDDKKQSCGKRAANNLQDSTDAICEIHVLFFSRMS